MNPKQTRGICFKRAVFITKSGSTAREKPQDAYYNKQNIVGVDRFVVGDLRHLQQWSIYQRILTTIGAQKLNV
jgi:hypothetical protein